MTATLDPVYISNLKDISYNVLKNNWDWVHLNYGLERGGKSGKSLLMAKELEKLGLKFDWSPDLPLVHFWEENMSKKLMNVPDKSIVIIDEGGENLLSRRAMEKEVVEIIQTLMVYGAKNVFLIINIPDWRWIDRYVRQSRVRSIARVRTFASAVEVEGETRFSRERGYYSFYSRRKVLMASNAVEAKLGKPSFSGRFPNFASEYPADWKNYSEKKNNFLLNYWKRKEEQAAKKSRRKRKTTED